MKGKVVVDNDIQSLYNQIAKLLENVDRFMTTANRKLNSELLIIRNINDNLQKRISNLEKQQSNSEQCSRRDSIEIYGILMKVPDQTLNQTTIKICKGSGIDVNPLDVKDCHRLSLGRNTTNTRKQMIVRFLMRNTPKLCFSPEN